VELLKLIQAYFGGIGRIGKERNDCCDFTVSSLNQIKYYERTCLFHHQDVYGALYTVQQRRYYSTKGFKKLNNDMHRSAAKYENVDIEKLNILKALAAPAVPGLLR
jgi:hypothetical protein